MKITTKYLVSSVISVAFFNFCVFPVEAKVHFEKLTPKVNEPTIVDFNQYDTQNKNKPFITGLTVENTDVMVYIDGTFVENATVNKTNTQTNDFYYFPTKSLTPGIHDVMLIAKDLTSLVLSPPTKRITFVIASVPAPTIVAPAVNSVFGMPKPLITGLTKSGTFIHVFIDGVYNGKTGVRNHQSGTADFAYKPFLNLKPGMHRVYLQAEDAGGRKSKATREIEFMIEAPLPAPTLLTPIADKGASNEPFIVGLAKNGSTVRIYIDNKLAGEIKPASHPSGTANFAFKSPKLTEGKHSLYTVATDNKGKTSKWSNAVTYVVVRKIAEEKKEKATEPDESAKEDKTDSGTTIMPPNDSNDGQGLIDDKAADEKAATSTGDSELDKILNPEGDENDEEAGLVDETNKKQGKLDWNLIIFILFLIAVIAWIFWVNRELIKERREKENSQDEK